MITGLAALLGIGSQTDAEYIEILNQIDLYEQELSEPEEESIRSFDIVNLNKYVMRLENAVEAVIKDVYLSERLSPREDDIYRLAMGASAYVFARELDIDQQDFVSTLYLQSIIGAADDLQKTKLDGRDYAKGFIFLPNAVGFVNVGDIHDIVMKLVPKEVSDVKGYIITSVLMDRENLERQGDYWVRSKHGPIVDHLSHNARIQTENYQKT
jgi:hypothetical protein